jgi:linoleoyl-CoA desaturase
MQAPEISTKTSLTTPTWSNEDERFRSFATAIDEVGKRARASVGASDLKYIRRVDAFSWTCGIFGRVLIALAGPVGFGIGVFALWINKQLQATEIGHTALHGAYNKLPDAGRFHTKRFIWWTPIDERSWMQGHNGRHHGHTNVAGKDPDIHFGNVRLTKDTPHRFHHYFQVPESLFLLWPNFGFVMNAHFTGLVDVYVGNGREDHHDFIEDRSWKSIFAAHVRAFRKYLPYYGVEYVLFPLLAGPFFAKVLLGNWLSEKMRDTYTAATIYCGHVGEETASYPEGTVPRSRGHRYAMQVEATNNFEVPLPISMLCGALDRQIEHHLFPTLPPNRLREIAPEVRAICEAHGVRYRTGSWAQVLGGSLRQLWRLSWPDPQTV